MLPFPVVSYQPGLWQTMSSMPRFERTNSSCRSPSSFATTDSLKAKVVGVEPATGSGLADALAVDRQVDGYLQRGEHLLPDHFAALLPGAEPVAVDDRPAVGDEAAARERDEVLDVAVGADRRDRGLDVVDPDIVVLERLVVLVELRLEPSEVGVAGGARVVVLPLASRTRVGSRSRSGERRVPRVASRFPRLPIGGPRSARPRRRSRSRGACSCAAASRSRTTGATRAARARRGRPRAAARSSRARLSFLLPCGRGMGPSRAREFPRPVPVPCVSPSSLPVGEQAVRALRPRRQAIRVDPRACGEHRAFGGNRRRDGRQADRRAGVDEDASRCRRAGSRSRARTRCRRGRAGTPTTRPCAATCESRLSSASRSRQVLPHADVQRLLGVGEVLVQQQPVRLLLDRRLDLRGEPL